MYVWCAHGHAGAKRARCGLAYRVGLKVDCIGLIHTAYLTDEWMNAL